MKKIKNLAILNLIFYVIAFLTSNLSQFKLFNQLNMGEVSNKYDSHFAPAGFTFSIWGVIYLALFGFTIYHLIKAFKEDEFSEANQVTVKIGNWFIINSIVITLWVFAFLNEYLLISVILIIAQLITLIVISSRLNLYNVQTSFKQKLFTQFSFSIYFAWICVATIANISAYLVSINWDGFGIVPTTWAIMIIMVAFILAVLMLKIKRNPFFAMVVLWAIFGIKSKNENLIPSNGQMLIIEVTYFCMGALIILILLQFYRNYKFKKEPFIK